MDRRLILIATFGLVAASGCSLADNTGERPGELGNGGFYFSCVDAVACKPYSDDAKNFPKAVSLGSTFQVRFVSNDEQTKGTYISLNSSTDRGITISPVGEYLSYGPNGMIAAKAGYGTIAARDTAGQLIDFINLEVAKPDTLVVYSADDLTAVPTRLETITLEAGKPATFRAFARQDKDKKVLAGSLNVEWKSSNPSLFEVDRTSDGKITLVRRTVPADPASRTGTLTASALNGMLTQVVPVEVKP